MRSVNRGDKPEILVQKEEEWTRELLEKLCNVNSFSDVPSAIKNKYKHQQIRDALHSMYDDYCCFCEGDFEITGYPEVEHYRPKAANPELCFKWENLHYICTKCNKKKNDKWDEQNPILDPTNDLIEDHLRFIENVIVYDEGDIRAKNTVDHLKLNREKLLNLRRQLYRSVEIVRKDPSKKETVKEMLFLIKDHITYRNYLLELINEM